MNNFNKSVKKTIKQMGKVYQQIYFIKSLNMVWNRDNTIQHFIDFSNLQFSLSDKVKIMKLWSISVRIRT